MINKYESFDELTPTMLNELIDHIEIHERDKKHCSRGVTQVVDVIFNFIGNISDYLPKPELSEEEKEAQRIIDERHEKQHQIYLRRKESGKARQYYERYKAKKKAHIKALQSSITEKDKQNGIPAACVRIQHQ